MPKKSTHTCWIVLAASVFLLIIIVTSVKIYKIAITEKSSTTAVGHGKRGG